MKLTDNQRRILGALREVSRANVLRYREKTPYLYEQDCEKLARGDQACALGLGGLRSTSLTASLVQQTI